MNVRNRVPRPRNSHPSQVPCLERSNWTRLHCLDYLWWYCRLYVPTISSVHVDLTVRRPCWVNSFLQTYHPHFFSSWLRVSPIPPQMTPPNCGSQDLVNTPKNLTLDFGPGFSVCNCPSTPAALLQSAASSFFLTQFVTSLLWVSSSVIIYFALFLSIRRPQWPRSTVNGSCC